jgi:acyl transferase domain-containing protein/acyl carrier protein
MDEREKSGNGLQIAIIGLAGRFPGARDVPAFWRNLVQGVESISFFSGEEPERAAGTPGDSVYVNANGILEDADLFDAELFGYSPREAEMIDPQQRIFLECGWQALEDAGCDPQRTSGLIGVYGGVGPNSYLFNLLSHPAALRTYGLQQIAIANDKDFLCTRLSYKLNLEGPSVAVQTACSTSLVAVHLACQGLLSGECDMALAGGVSVSFPQRVGYLYQRGGVLSPDGHCRPFDARAAGTVGGQGAGVVVLKRLSDALADGDTVRAVILGSAVNNDGAQKVGFTAPRVDGQAKVVMSAQLAADVSPETISYVEAHGTATEVGDPIEIAALTHAFRSGTDRRGFCAIGSVKGNIGHLDAAAGIAGLIKTVLALEHGVLPPSLHFDNPNPQIDFDDTPFHVNARLSDWSAGLTPRRAGVSSFGLGGTNAHVVLEEAPAPEPSSPGRSWQLLPLSAMTGGALEAATANLAAHLREVPGQELEDVAYTLQTGRRQLDHRRVLVCRGREDALEALEGRQPLRLLTAVPSRRQPAISFLFPGLGDHYVGMGRGLYHSEPCFREEIDRCADGLAPDLDLRELLYPRAPLTSEAAGTGPAVDLRQMVRGRTATEAEEGGLARTRVAQPALFAVEYALARLWMSWGIRPQAMLGHSLGEYVAACLAGVLSLEDALRLVAARARLIDGLPAGAMLAVSLPEEEVRPLLGEQLSLSAVNGPAVCVVAGPAGAVAALEERLAREGTTCRRLRTSHAFHSREMEPAAPELLELVRSVELKPPQIPYLSNVTGGWIEAAEATDPGYWVRHLVQPVRFAAALVELGRRREALLLEVGPGQMLSSLAVQQTAGGAAFRSAVPSLRHEYDRRSDQELLLRSLGELWLAGAEVDWSGFHAGQRRRRVPLPAYPFERKRFWIDPPAAVSAAPERETEAAAERKLPDPADWFFAPSWKQSPRLPLPPRAEPAGAWLVLLDGHGVGARLVERLAGEGREVLTAAAGLQSGPAGERSFSVDPRSEDGYEALLAAMDEPPARIVHLWSLSPAAARLDLAAFDEAQDLGFHSLLALARALERRFPARSVEISVIVNGLGLVESGDQPCPEKATLLGPARVIPQESPGLACRVIDVDLREVATEGIDELWEELRQPVRASLVACRGRHRWVPLAEPVRLERSAPEPPRLRREGVYLITGGLGGLGLALAGFLARSVDAKLVLLGRTPLPERSEWPRLLDEDGDVARKLRGLLELEEAGAEVLACAADVTDLGRMREVIEQAGSRFGRIDGMFHAAGLPGGGLIQLKSREMAARVMAPKTRGLLVLDALLGDAGLDFMVLFSSISALAGEIGQADYSAANLFLDAYAQRQRWAGNAPTFAVDWCQWEWDGWTEASARLDPRIQRELVRQRHLFGLTFEEGMEALCRILATELPQVIVSTRGAPAEASTQSMALVLEGLARAPRGEGSRHPRPALSTPYAPPAEGTERDLARIWEELLGLEEVGAGDSFFDLGGDSLLGIQLLSRVHETFRVDLSLRSLFEGPTPREMAAAIEALAGLPDASLIPEVTRREEGAELIAEVDGLSDQEVDQLLVRLLTQREEAGA